MCWCKILYLELHTPTFVLRAAYASDAKAKGGYPRRRERSHGTASSSTNARSSPSPSAVSCFEAKSNKLCLIPNIEFLEDGVAIFRIGE
jgi:hypothetical protein